MILFSIILLLTSPRDQGSLVCVSQKHVSLLKDIHALRVCLVRHGGREGF